MFINVMQTRRMTCVQVRVKQLLPNVEIVKLRRCSVTLACLFQTGSHVGKLKLQKGFIVSVCFKQQSVICFCCNHSFYLYWPLQDYFTMEAKSTVLLCLNVIKSSSEDNMEFAE